MAGAHTAPVPFRPKDRRPGVTEAIEAVIEADQAVKRYDEDRRAVVAVRATAIAAALERGATLAELGRRLGVSPERIRQMREAR